MDERTIAGINEELALYGLCVTEENKDSTETKRLIAEAKLFSERGWQKYILFLADLLKQLEENKAACFQEKSAMDSVILNKMVNREEKAARLLGSDKSWEILSNDAIRLELYTRFAFKELLVKNLKDIDSAIEKALKRHPLKYRQSLKSVSLEGFGGVEMIVISETDIPDEDFEIIVKERKESTEAEAAVLRKYLIITVDAGKGI